MYCNNIMLKYTPPAPPPLTKLVSYNAYDDHFPLYQEYALTVSGLWRVYILNFLSMADIAFFL